VFKSQCVTFLVDISLQTCRKFEVYKFPQIVPATHLGCGRYRILYRFCLHFSPFYNGERIL